MIDRILSLLNTYNISAFKLTKDLNLSNSAITDWKKGKAKPSVDALIKIADYFNVSTDYLLGRADNFEIEKKAHKATNDTPTHVIAYLDVLGAKQAMKRNNSDFTGRLKSSYRDAKKLLDIMEKENSKPQSVPTNPIYFKIFSDNILLTMEYSLEKNDSTFLWSLRSFVNIISLFQLVALADHQLFMRGCICYGSLMIDDSCVSGSGLVTAVIGEENIAVYPRIVMYDDVAEHYQIINQFFAEHNCADYNAVLCDFDGLYFLNYLKFCSEKAVQIQTVKNINDKNMQNNTNLAVLQKYRWVAKYIERYCNDNLIALQDTDEKVEIAAYHGENGAGTYVTPPEDIT